MKRMKLVIAALALVVSMFAAFAGPAMAQEYNPDGYYWDGYYYAPYTHGDLFGPCGLFGHYDPYTGMCYRS